MKRDATVKRNITILGSTGSIGESTLDVIARHPERFSVFALVANSRDDILLQQCLLHRPQIAVLIDAAAAQRLRDGLKTALGAGSGQIEVQTGEAAAIAAANAAEADTVVAAIVGAAGLPATLAAAHAGKRILLANKEALVMTGTIFLDAVQKSGAQILPVDSEHNAIFQSLPPGLPAASRGKAYGASCLPRPADRFAPCRRPHLIRSRRSRQWRIRTG